MELIKFSVLLIICVIGCKAMSLSEVEDFSKFLRRTSQLDQPIKTTGTTDVGYEDDADPVSDHAWEESGKFEGDLILNERQRRLIIEDVVEGLSRNGLKDSTKRWPNNEVIYYIQREHFTSEHIQAIETGMEELARASCVKFRAYKKGDKDAVVIQGSRRGCFSQVGYQGGYQVMNLSGRHPVGRGCFRPGTVIHEFLHTLGFYHMQSSPDRDDYVDVLWENIIEKAKNNFRKYNSFAVSDFGVGYDYESVLHYSRRAFSSNGRETLVPKQRGAAIGQRIGLSDKDTLKLNKMYCDSDSDNNNADEDSNKRKTVTKKNPKNKPFEGHGIGYQQGKTVVIKIAKNHRMTDQPPYQVYNSFSTLSQPTFVQGYGIESDLWKEKYDDKKPGKDHLINSQLAGSLNKEEVYLNNRGERLGKYLKNYGFPSQILNYQSSQINSDYRNNSFKNKLDQDFNKFKSNILLPNEENNKNIFYSLPKSTQEFNNYYDSGPDVIVSNKNLEEFQYPNSERQQQTEAAESSSSSKPLATHYVPEESFSQKNKDSDEKKQKFVLLAVPVVLLENLYRTSKDNSHIPPKENYLVKDTDTTFHDSGLRSVPPRLNKETGFIASEKNIIKNAGKDTKVYSPDIIAHSVNKFIKSNENMEDLNDDEEYNDYSIANNRKHFTPTDKSINNDNVRPYHSFSESYTRLPSRVLSDPYASIEKDWNHRYEKYSSPFSSEKLSYNK